ncbi:hypothetical protein [Candidatus Pelagisphaera phototrophica]|uniref:hypothetical protein n=1 Tax=Candidatus Pelagisphaera phototrophica TaxID=2684113 RepID=UPI0019F3940D|nr:hypothetical protein [Candidatus Pelagisphaera phototrophica]QXD31684.1 hypothetical protein GA004_15390 [Candidatus Pelagisphaera phototrophica]
MVRIQPGQPFHRPTVSTRAVFLYPDNEVILDLNQRGGSTERARERRGGMQCMRATDPKARYRAAANPTGAAISTTHRPQPDGFFIQTTKPNEWGPAKFPNETQSIENRFNSIFGWLLS